MKIMIADDDSGLRTLVRCLAEDMGYGFCCAEDGVQALEMCLEERPDLLILDVMMPKMTGFEVCRRLREAGFESPIMYLSARGDIVDKSVAFNAGGDDYVVKPFNTDELVLRIAALLRRSPSRQGPAGEDCTVIRCDNVTIDRRSREVTIDGESVALSKKEYEILALFASCPGEVLTQEEIIAEIWGEEYVGTNPGLAVYIRRIREKIEADPSHPQLLQTVWGVGYRLTKKA